MTPGRIPEVLIKVMVNDAVRDWRQLARCRDVDPELFFPTGTTGPAEQRTQQAKNICALCPVRSECLQWAQQTGQDAGIWGGLDEAERRRKRRSA